MFSTFVRMMSLLLVGGILIGEETSSESPVEQTLKPTTKSTLTSLQNPFTGKIIGSRVRLRLQPHLDSAVLKEFSQNDLVQVVGEIDDFYAILPEKNQKGYVFRTYVLDGVIEGNNVNLRVKPDMTAQVITQLHQGEAVDGKQCPENPKWLEVTLPADVRFYVAKDFVKNEGPLSLYDQRNQQLKVFLSELDALQETVQQEFTKAYDSIDFSKIKEKLETLGNQTKVLFPEIAKKTAQLLAKIQEKYFEMSIEEKQAHIPPVQEPTPPPTSFFTSQEPMTCLFLKEQERVYILKKIEEKEATSQEDLYTQEMVDPIILKGKLIPFERTLKIKPGDYILLHPTTRVPIAYLYSTTLDLQPYVGMMVSLQAAPRPDHNFALPAYFIHKATVIPEP